MKKMFTLLSVCLLVSLAGFSQIKWTFGTLLANAFPDSNSYAATIAVSAMSTNQNNGGLLAPLNTSSASTGYPGASGFYNIGAAARTGGFDSTSNAYFEFTLAPANSASVVLSTIRFGTRSTSTGPAAYAIRTSRDDFKTTIAAGTIAITSPAAWVLAENTNLNLVGNAGENVTVRIYGFNGTGNAAASTINWRIDDVVLNGSVLPVTLSNFTASVVNNKVQLNWNTANEVNMKGFSVEKSSDARVFSEVSYVAASGKGSYSAQDAVSSSTVYYRLKMTNTDGSFTYSKNIPVNASLVGSSALRVYPNPVVNSAMISHPQAGANASLKVTDLNGRVLLNYSLQPNAVQTSINVNQLTSGTYLLVYRDATGKAVSTRLAKQ